MSAFRVSLIAVNPQEPQSQTPPVQVLVDTGAELSSLPRDVLLQAGITPRRKLRFQTATSETFEREIGYAILRVDDHETNDTIVFAEPGDVCLLGVHTIEGFGVTVDPIGHRFLATPYLMAAAERALSMPHNRETQEK